MTLGSWFREYVYIPLGGNRVSKARLFFNLFVVWFLTGFWHGAGWNFIVWGLFFAVLIMLERSFLLSWLEKLPSIVSRIYLILMILISWVFFSHDSLMQGLDYLKVMFNLGGTSFSSTQSLYSLTNYGLILGIGILFATPLMNKLKQKAPDIVLYLFYVGILVLSTAYLVDSTFNPFLYFRF